MTIRELVDALEDVDGVVEFVASLAASFARSLSSRVDRWAGCFTNDSELEDAAILPCPGLPERWVTKVFLKLLNADSANCEEESDVRSPKSREGRD